MLTVFFLIRIFLGLCEPFRMQASDHISYRHDSFYSFHTLFFLFQFNFMMNHFLSLEVKTRTDIMQFEHMLYRYVYVDLFLDLVDSITSSETPLILGHLKKRMLKMK